MAADPHRSSPTRSRHARRLGAGLAALALAGAFAPSAIAGGATVTRGEFHAFNGSELPIIGRAMMVRTAGGRTLVTVHVAGLAAGIEYASHVHAAACATGLADGHYRFDPAGAAFPPNEIWPGPLTANRAGVGNSNTIANGTAGPGAVSVVIHAPGGAKIACADLA